MNCLPLTFLPQWKLPILDKNMTAEIIRMNDHLVMHQRYVELFARCKDRLNGLKIIIFIDTMQPAILMSPIVSCRS